MSLIFTVLSFTITGLNYTILTFVVLLDSINTKKQKIIERKCNTKRVGLLFILTTCMSSLHAYPSSGPLLYLFNKIEMG